MNASIRLLVVTVISTFLIMILVVQSSAQQTCAEINAVTLQCAPDRMISGAPPNCACEGVPIDPPLELTCERNFGCPGSGEVGTGEWPECGCVAPDAGPEPGGGTTNGGPEGPGPSPGLGGAHTCEMFLECPSGSTMEVHGGKCTCTLVMLPQIRE